MEATIADRFRAAIASGAFWTADELLTAYRAEVEARWNAATEEERAAIRDEVNALLGWARRLTLVRRSHAQSKLVRINSQRAYAAAARSSGVWEVQG